MIAHSINESYVVIGVREHNSHYCALARNSLFLKITVCAVLKEDQYGATSKAMQMPFKQGFVSYKIKEDGKEKFISRPFKGNYEQVY
jgi:hypothetical protein